MEKEVAMRFLILFVFLAGCASYDETHTSDGRVGYSINCTRWAWNRSGQCYEIAGKICEGRGYDIIEKSEPTIIFPKRPSTFVIVCKG